MESPAPKPIKKFDHIIIGAGIGGLSCGTLLAKSGLKVAILEQHRIPGGSTHTFQRKKNLSWDVGLHYVGGMEKGEFLRELFDHLTNHQLQWQDTGDTVDNIIIGADSYLIPKGHEQQIQHLLYHFPKEENAIRSYFQLVKKTAAYSKGYFAEKVFPNWLSSTLGPIVRYPFISIAKKTTAEVLDGLTSNQRLKAVLCGTFGNYGLTPQNSSFGIHAIVASHYLNGAWYPKGGSQNLSKHMLNVFQQHGGELFLNTPVEQILTDRGAVTGVETKEYQFESPSVISSAGAKKTFGELLQSQSTVAQPKWPESSSSYSATYLAIDRSKLKTPLSFPSYNTWFYESDDFEGIAREANTCPQKSLPFLQYSFPSEKDPDWLEQDNSPIMCQAIGIANSAWFQSEGTIGPRGSNGYKNYKAHFQQACLERIQQQYPINATALIHVESSTPLSHQRFMHSLQGEMYGLAHDTHRFQHRNLRTTSHVKGLRLVGQDLTTVGVASVLFSGLLQASSILKWKTSAMIKGIKSH